MTKPCYLYKITNNVNGKMYIGLTGDPKRRQFQHYHQRKHKTISIIHQAIDKYSVDNFSFDVICVGTRDYIAEMEVKAIYLYQTTDRKFGYNIKPGGEKGRGYQITNTRRDKPQFVSGFWFPNIRTAMSSLGISKQVFQLRRSKGTLGDIEQYRVNGGRMPRASRPFYNAGFWWDSVARASSILGLTEGAIHSRLVRGNDGDRPRQQKDQAGELNHMYGISAKDHPSSKPMTVLGVDYDCLKHAVEATGISKYIIRKRIKEGHPDFVLKLNQEEILNG
jgi:group I intron endonuclease